MNKASGGDGIPVELLQILKDDAVNPACRGTSGGRRKAVRDRLALQGGTGDFP